MDEDTREQTDPKKPNSGWPWNFVWLVLAFVPSLLALKIGMSPKFFLLLNATCSLLVGFGLWRGFIKSKALRGVLGLGVGGLFFYLNLSFFAILSTGIFLFNYVVSFSNGCCSSPP